MTDLPFELDEAELIEACALALRSAEPFAAKAAPAAQYPAQTPDPPDRLRPSLTIEDSAQSPLLLQQTQMQDELWELPPAQMGGADVEAISRAVERDARRFEPT